MDTQKFNVGDRVIYLGGEYTSPLVGGEGTVVEVGDIRADIQWDNRADGGTAPLYTRMDQIAPAPKSFKVGDIVHWGGYPYPVTKATEGSYTTVRYDRDGRDYVADTKFLTLVAAAPQVQSQPQAMVSLEGIKDTTAKATNPKDAIGSTKLGMSFVPDSLKVYAALAFTEGATKYGSYNWRVAGVRASIYKSAAERHLAKYWNGEWADATTGVPHLASVIACCAIILDANACDKLTDDRPPAMDMSKIIDGLEPMVKHLMDMHKDKHPHHHTEMDKAA